MQHHFQLQPIDFLLGDSPNLRVVLVLVVEIVNPLDGDHQGADQESKLEHRLPVYAIVVDHELLLPFLVPIDEDQGDHVG